MTYIHGFAEQQVAVIGEDGTAGVIESESLGSGLLFLDGPA